LKESPTMENRLTFAEKNAAECCLYRSHPLRKCASGAKFVGGRLLQKHRAKGEKGGARPI
jgi:hypothetical protein